MRCDYMDQDRKIHNLKQISLYSQAMEKLYTKKNIKDSEIVFLLEVALLFFRTYEKDKRYTTFAELAYHIILRYSLFFDDYEPLYDFSVNMGFYPIAQSLTRDGYIDFDNITSSLIHIRIQEEYARDELIETFDQKNSRELLLTEKAQDSCYIAPTSFGKSDLILDHIKESLGEEKKIAIIVPSKSLLMQTYRNVRKRNFNCKIILHDEMYTGENCFVAVLTQERALRLLDKWNISFDVLYIDEAHNIFDKNPRSLLLSRLIKLNRIRNRNSETMYFSPLISNSDNLQMFHKQEIKEYRIRFNMKDPDYYEYTENGSCFKYNRYLDLFFEVGKSAGLFEYIIESSGEKNFCYLYTPKKIEHFAQELAKRLPDISSRAIDEIITNLRKYVHEDFLGIDLIRKGIIYLHGKMPEAIKDYLEYKFSSTPEMKYLIANKVILEGVNMPIDTLFVLSGNNMQKKDLVNLIGRVNRLDQVFTKPANLKKLMPQIHFVNSDFYNRTGGKLRKKLELLKNTENKDQIRNPVLSKFDSKDVAKNSEDIKKVQEILDIESGFFADACDELSFLKKRIITLGINVAYSESDSVCDLIKTKMEELRIIGLSQMHFLDRLQFIFINDLEEYISDKEFLRLGETKALNYYKKFYQDRKKALKDRIVAEFTYFQRRIRDDDCKMYIGNSYGEQSLNKDGSDVHKKVYIDLSQKTNRELINLAIVKLKMEDDFVGFKLKMFFQLMYEYKLLTLQEYEEIMYGTTDDKKIELSRIGLPISLINRLEVDGQLLNVRFDKNGNLIMQGNFENYRNQADDYYKFELNSYL